MHSASFIAAQVAALLLAGAWRQRPMEQRLNAYLGAATRAAQARVIESLLAECNTNYPPSPRALRGWLLQHTGFAAAIATVQREKNRPPPVLDPPVFAPAPAFVGIDAPRIETPRGLATWLGVSLAHLDWLADSKRQHDRTTIPILRHYNYRFEPKRTGAPRLIEAPKPALKAIQRQILREILNPAPVSAHAHGFVRGRSCLSGAQLHAGESAVVRADLRDFFPSISAGRIHGLFRSIGYPTAVARLLTGLTTTATPAAVFEGQAHDWRIRKMFGAPHLPQGAPTSPALANLCAFRFDQRCAGLAAAFDARFTRYADDLAFSGGGEFADRARVLLAALNEIAGEEGFALRHDKTAIMRSSGRQAVTGIIVNRHINVGRADFDTLKAVLHNCRRNGPSAENRNAHADFRAHLDGRVGWVEQVNPARGAKLRAIYEAIAW